MFRSFDKRDIDFIKIGRKSKAHILSHKVYQRRLKPDIVANGKELIKHLFRLT